MPASLASSARVADGGAPGTAGPQDPAPARSAVTAGEALVLAAIVGVALVAEVGLLLAHARQWSLPATVAGVALVVAVSTALAARRHPERTRPRLEVAPRQLAVLGGLGLLAGILFTPGFPAAMAGWDPGVYLNHGLAIVRTGAYDLADPVVDKEPPLPDAAREREVRFPGIAESDHDEGRSVPGFFHLYPALLAPAADVAGERGMVTVNPVLGVLGVLALALAVERAFNPLAGALAGVLASVCVLEVWHARYPTSEALTQLLVMGAVLALAVSAQSRWAPPAGAAGVLVGLTWLARPDGFVVVLAALAGLALVAAAGRFDRRALAFAAGLGVVLPHALAQSYWFASHYALGNGVPGLLPMAAVLAAAVATVALAHRHRRRLASAAALAASRRWQRRVGVAVVAGFGLVLAANLARPLLGPDAIAPGVDPHTAHAYWDARNLVRLSWFLTPVGIAAAWAGLAVVALRPWRPAPWLLAALPLGLLPLYLYDPRIAPRLIWWTRRFVPFVLAGLIALTAAALAAGLAHRGRWRWPVVLTSAAAAVYLAVSWFQLSRPLLDHDELAGSFAVHHRVVAAAERADTGTTDDAGDAVWLWSRAPGPAVGSADAFASTLLFREGAVVAQLAADAGPGAVDAYRRAFPARPVFVVADGDDVPSGLAGLDLVPVTRVRAALPLWEITLHERPDEATVLPFAFTVYRLAGT